MIVIVDYGVGNLGSIANMLKKIGAAAIIASDPAVIREADKLILPGVGAFDHGMKSLAKRGIIPLLNELVLERKVPILGLCLGMQLLTRKSEEGRLPGLGWLDAETVSFKFDESQAHLKIPHMGWNSVRVVHSHPLLDGLKTDNRFYFVHSYYLTCANMQDMVGETEYGLMFPSIVARNNVMGVQFHPEKSHKFGMRLLRNFAENIR